MNFSTITPQWLKKQQYAVQSIYVCPTINGVILKELKVNLDGRGDLIELWSKPWIKKEDFCVPQHIYQSATDYGVVKCWHLHKIHTDQIAVTRGKLQITLVDSRKDSPTFGHVNTIFMGVKKPRLLKIPPGIIHGWKALSRPEAVVVNFATEVYDPEDEYKLPWDCFLKNIWEPKNG
jgi:dTDP-4-dehydrorhamnose 3,5-epimerase